jgi:hypothetical protein
MSRAWESVLTHEQGNERIEPTCPARSSSNAMVPVQAAVIAGGGHHAWWRGDVQSWAGWVQEQPT